tara:strand:+ start:2786 stop:3457 length:672 start_codon:yes stop_codon:yes gene_type:complete
MKNFILSSLIFSLSLLNAQDVEKSISSNSSLIKEGVLQESTKFNDEIKRLSIGFKVGIPNIASLGLQYNLPIFNNHLAPFIEYSSYSYDDAEVEGNLNFSEFGASYFFNESGKGLYVGVGLSSLKLDVLYNNISLDFGKTGSGSTKITLNTTNLKLGLKTGGRIYLRLEMGYGIGDLPTQVTFVASENSNPSYTETTTEDIPDIPGISESGLIIGNIGFGLSF